jgi:hypothetical protein
MVATEKEEAKLRRLIAQADAMIAELRSRGARGDLELARGVETQRERLQQRLTELMRRS